MRAVLFFRVLEHGRKIYNRERNLFMADLCDVAAVANNIENHKTFKPAFIERVSGKPKRKPLDYKDDKTAQILSKAFRAATPGANRRH